MIVKSIDDILGTSSDVQGDGWVSRRLLLAGDGLGYSFHETVMEEGSITTMHYKHHVESVYCLSGTAEVTNEETGEVHLITPGTIYVLDGHERHTFRALTEFRDICIFTPAVAGNEKHDEEGAYPPP